MVNIPNPPVEVGDDLYVYYSGSKNHHDWWIVGQKEGLTVPEAYDMNMVDYSMGLAKMKKDRFVSLSAFDVRQGVLVTKPFWSLGRQLAINANCRKTGSIEVEVADKDGNILPGFERQKANSQTRQTPLLHQRCRPVYFPVYRLNSAATFT